MPQSRTEPSLTSASPSAEEAAGSPLDSLRGTHAHLRDGGRYQIIAEYGRGGLGRVSRAHDIELGRDVAIKELISRDHVSEVRFVREAMITARLEHPNIVPVHESGRWHDGTPFYAMKLVAGRSLRDLIAERATVDQRIALLHHVIAIADAMAYAHGLNIIHRDLKPANVIIGDFGETIVIDWGLAKDLSYGGESPTTSAPPCTASDDSLTATGAVLGTPSYMPPEQARGENVDQRADVFAIGAMLWELCSLHKVPPTNTRHRHRLLRQARIDRDLIAILDKALDPEARRRYPDAGALASDLKAFKSGARIGARNYSLFAMLHHWTRRHRAAAISAMVAFSIAVTGITLYIRNIAVERDRADMSRQHADSALARAEAANDELTLEHAGLLLHRDPTASATALARYHGNDVVQQARLAAEAKGRGIARSVFKPHGDTVWFLVGEPDGSVVSLGEDRRIRVTLDSRSTTLAADVSNEVRFAYAPPTRLLAYATAPAGIALLDLNTRVARKLDVSRPRALAFDPDGSRLAAIDDRDIVTVWSVAGVPTQLYRTTVSDGYWIAFATAEQLVLTSGSALKTLDVSRSSAGRQNARPLDVSALDVRSDSVVVGNANGDIVMLSAKLAVMSRMAVCHDRVFSVKFVPRSEFLAFACRDSIAGILRYDTSSRKLNLASSFSIQGAWQASPDYSGRWVFFLGQSSTSYIYDMSTQLLSRLEGQEALVSYVAPPTRDYHYVLTGDINGSIRAWELPSRWSRTLLRVPSPLYTVAFVDGREIAVAGSDGIVRMINIDTGSVRELASHHSIISKVQTSPDSKYLSSLGRDEGVRVWSVSTGKIARIFDKHDGTVQDIDYLEHGKLVVSAGDDGRLFAWNPGALNATLLLSRPRPLVTLEVLSKKQTVIVEDAAGSIWEVTLGGITSQIRTEKPTWSRLRSSPSGAFLATGSDDGEVIVYNTDNWTIVARTVVGGRVGQLQFDPKDRDLLIASEGGGIRLLNLDGRRSLSWTDIPLAARDIAYSPDGEMIAILCMDGAEWFYAIRNSTWVYTHAHEADVRTGRFSSDGNLFVSIDIRGSIIVHDLTIALSSAH